MAKVNLAHLKKDEIVKLYNGRCEHGHRFLEHYGCYVRQEKHPLRIGFLDIEASNLSADFGIILCYAIKQYKSRSFLGKVITKEDLTTSLDKNVVKQLIEDMKQFDLLVTYYGTKFDIPFIRTRALSLGVPFPPFGSIQHKDMYYAAKMKLRLSSNRLENVGRVILGKTKKTRIESKYWIKALQGDEASLVYIFDHCLRDVADLESVYNKLIEFMRNGSKSI